MSSSTQYFNKLKIKDLTLDNTIIYLGTGVSSAVPNSSIILGTTGPFSVSTPGFYVNPINNNTTSNVLFYDPITYEITFGNTSAGSQGPQGPDGNAGLDGAQGPQGPDGNAGLDGAQGPQGPDGNAGLDGAQGPQGPDGNAGLDGAQGPQGPDGNAGLDGAQGPQGPDGGVGPVAGLNQQILFNDSGNSTGSTNLTYDYTNNVVNMLGGIVLNSSVHRKYYSYTGTTSSSSPIIEIAFDTTVSPFVANVTAILKSAGTSMFFIKCVGDGTDAIVIDSSSITNSSSSSVNWDYQSLNYSNASYITFSTDVSPSSSIYYNISVEVINGKITAITDGTINQNYTY
jgi:hypothetical protein